MRRLLQVIRRYSKPRIVVLAVIFGSISGAASTGLLIVINRTLFHDNPHELVMLLYAFIGLCFLIPLARIASGFILTALGTQTSYELRIELSGRVLAAPLRRLEKIGTHRLMVALTDDVAAVTDALVDIPVLIINLALVIGCLVYLGWLSLPILGVVLAFMIFGIITYQVPILAGIRRQKIAREISDEMFAHFRGITQGIKELKIHSLRRTDFHQSLGRTAGRVRDVIASARRIFIAANSWGSLLFFIAVGLVLYATPAFVVVDRETVAGYVLVLIYLMAPLQVLLNSFPNLTQAGVSLEKLQKLGLALHHDDDKEPGLVEGEVAQLPTWKKLEFVGVSHTYQDDSGEKSFRLGPLDLSFEPGELVFLTGGNGSGKTTLAKLLVGLYEPESGEIRLDGKPIPQEEIDSYRQQFSVVFNDFFLFETLFGIRTPELDESATRYLENLYLKNKVRVAGGRLSTTDLSAGQRKRLALLTAFLEDRPIYLFDEWAADQDPEFKRLFYYEILPELRRRGKTLIVISHDDHYYHVPDRIIKLDYGQLEYDKPLAETEYAPEQVPA